MRRRMVTTSTTSRARWWWRRRVPITTTTTITNWVCTTPRVTRACCRHPSRRCDPRTTVSCGRTTTTRAPVTGRRIGTASPPTTAASYFESQGGGGRYHVLRAMVYECGVCIEASIAGNELSNCKGLTGFVVHARYSTIVFLSSTKLCCMVYARLERYLVSTWNFEAYSTFLHIHLQYIFLRGAINSKLSRSVAVRGCLA